MERAGRLKSIADLAIFRRQPSPPSTLPSQRALLAAERFQEDEDTGIGFLYSGWCQAALPHRRQPDDAIWRITTNYVDLLVEPGHRIVDNQVQKVGVPYGTRARLILLYLQSEALRTSSRDIELGHSLHHWLGQLNIPVSGQAMAAVREQADRISRCRMSFQITRGPRTALINQHIVDTAMFITNNPDQKELFLDTARLSETFFKQLQDHPVPILEAAIRSLANNSNALDCYVWLAYRLHALTKPTTVSWTALHAQFGTTYKEIRQFRIRFIETVKIALAAYPEAKVELDEEGLRLLPSKPAVARLTGS